MLKIVKANTSFIGKEAKNFSNYRESSLIVCTWLMRNQSNDFAFGI